MADMPKLRRRQFPIFATRTQSFVELSTRIWQNPAFAINASKMGPPW
jgi:hypothetical protein